MTRRRPVAAIVVAAVGAAALVAGCLRDTSGPDAYGRARFALAPTFAAGAPETVAFDQIRVTVVRAACAGADGGQPGPAARTAVDTLVPFPAELDSINLRIVVPLEAAREEFLVYVRLITPAGDTAFRTEPYPECVVAFAGGAGAVLEPVLKYVGIGANAASVVISPVETLVSFGRVLDLTAMALDATGKPIPGVPITWSSLDPARVLVPNAAVGQVLGGGQRGPAGIVARLPTGLADTVLITAQPLPSLLSIVSGNNQTGVPGVPLLQPLGVRVLGPDGLGVERVPVRFRPLIAGALVQDTVVMSDATGYAETQGTLPLVPVFTSVFEASVSGVTPAVFGGLALAPIPSIAQVLVTSAGSLLDALLAPLQFFAEARDSAGNPVPATFSWTSSDLSVASVDPASGLATAVGNGVATITATAQGVTGSAQLDVIQLVTQLLFGTQPGNIAAGFPIGPVVVRALDRLGNVAQNFTQDVTLGLTGCPATLLGTPTAPAVQGVATFPDLTIQRACTAFQLTAVADTLAANPSAPFSVLPGPAAIIAPVGGAGLTGTVGALLGQPLVVRVTDQYDNPVSAYPVSWVTTGGGLLSPASSVTDASGLASSSWTLGTLAGTQSAQTQAGTLPSVPFSAIANPGPATQLVYLVQPSTVAILAPINPPVQVGAQDQYGNLATSWTNPITVGMGNNPVGALLGGNATSNPVNGVAIFNNLSIDLVGNLFTLIATSGSLPPLESAPFNITLF